MEHHPCDKCTYKGCSRDALRQHKKRKHLNSLLHPCELCNMSFSSAQGLTLHQTLVHNKKVHQCDECKESFKTVSGLSAHKRQIHVGMFTCNICASCHVTQASLDDHMTRRHPRCKTCFQRLGTVEEHASHRLSEHSGVPKIMAHLKDVPFEEYAEDTDASGRSKEWARFFKTMNSNEQNRKLFTEAEDTDLKLREFVNSLVADITAGRLYHMMCSSEAGANPSEDFGHLMYFPFPFASICCCNVLDNINPAGFEGDLKEISHLKHMHWIVTLAPCLKDYGSIRTYLQTQTKIPNAHLKQIKTKIHALNCCLYLMGKEKEIK